MVKNIMNIKVTFSPKIDDPRHDFFISISKTGSTMYGWKKLLDFSPARFSMNIDTAFAEPFFTIGTLLP